jgi:site-specific recombinase XerD
MAALIWKKGNPYAVYRDKPKGKQHWVSLQKYKGCRITSKKQAEKVFREWRRYGRFRISDANEIRDFFLEYRRRGEITKSANTQKSDDSRLKIMESWLADQGIKSLSAITSRAIEDFQAWKVRGSTPTTVNRYIEVLRAVLNMAVRDGLIDKNPAAGLKMLPARGRRQIRALTDQEVQIIETEFPEPARTFCLFGLYAGLRRAEIVYLEWSDISRKTITIQGKPEFSPKGIEPRTIPMAPLLERALAAMRRRGRFIFDDGEGNPAFSINRWYKMIVVELFAQYGIEGNLHTLRHTFCTRLVRAGVALPIVQRLARHKDFKTTLKYTHLDQADLRAGIEQLPR